MIRTIKVSKGTDLKSLRTTLLDARFTGAGGDAAIAELRALNPHVDLDAIKADTLLFVPDRPAFKPAVADAPHAAPGEALRTMVADALGETVKRQQTAHATRSAERADLATVLKGAEMTRAVAADQAVARQVEMARRSLADEEKEDKSSENELASLTKAAFAALGELKSVLG